MTTHDNVQEILSIGARLNAPAVAREVADLTASRIKGWAANAGGGRSASNPLPLPDALDRRVRREHAEFKKHIESALRSLEKAHDLQTGLLVRLTIEQAQEILAMEAGGVPCSNCKTPAAKVKTKKEQRVAKLLAGRCRPCHEYQRDHGGVERPAKLWAKDPA